MNSYKNFLKDYGLRPVQNLVDFAPCVIVLSDYHKEKVRVKAEVQQFQIQIEKRRVNVLSGGGLPVVTYRNPLFPGGKRAGTAVTGL
jgi:hypothetical protein